MTPGAPLEFALARPEDTDALGALLAAALPDAAVVFLRGELGAGKSSLARALLRARGVTGPVKSPTYSLLERYGTARGDALHLDLYRIAEAAELDFLGLDEAGAGPVLWLVEWPDRGAGRLPAPDLDVRLEVDGTGRRATLHSTGTAVPPWWATLSKMAGCSGSA
jgi:tRNA threonylcarbamoyl adenosine modification protein YjeE